MMEEIGICLSFFVHGDEVTEITIESDLNEEQILSLLERAVETLKDRLDDDWW